MCAVQLNLSANFSCFDNCSLGDFFYDVGGLNYLSLDTGYRYDKVTNRAVLYGPATDVFAATQAQTEINSYILGVKAQFEFKRILIKGNYHFGWIGSGKYLHEGQHGNLQGYLNDGSAALGFAFPSESCWLAAIYGGWSYDALFTTANHVIAPNTTALVNVGSIKTKTTIHGPWVGTDVILRPFCNTTFIIGDDIHFCGRWNGTNRFVNGAPGATFGEIEGFSSNRNQHNMWGNVFRFEGLYNFCHGLTVGFNLQYTHWISSGHGLYSPINSPLPTGVTINQITNVKWNSFSATATLAYEF